MNAIRKHWQLSILLLFTIIFRVFIILNSQQNFFAADDAVYAEIGRFLHQGKWGKVFHPTWPPLFPILSSLAYLLVSDWVNAMRVISLVSFVFLLISLYILIKHFFNKTSAILFCTVFSLYNPILKYSIFTLSDMLAMSLSISAMTLFILGITVKRVYLFLSSILIGLTFLTRSEGSLFFIISSAFLFLYLAINTFKNKKLLVKNLKIFLIFVASFIVTISPYAIFISSKLGAFTISQKFNAQIQQGHSFKLNDQETTWIQEVVSVKYPNYQSNYFKGGTWYLLENIDWFIWWFVEKLGWWSKVYLSNFPIWSVPIIIFGMLCVFQQKHRLMLSYFLLIILIAIPITIFSTPLADIRYLLWAFPILLIFYYKGLQSILNLFTKNKLLVMSIIVISTLTFPAFRISDIINPKDYALDYTRNNYRPEIVQAGLWLKENSKSSEPRIMMKHEAIEFYSDGTTIYIPQEQTLDQVIDYGKKHKADYLVAWTDSFSADSNLSILLEDNQQFNRLKREAVFTSEARKVVIFSFSD